MARKHAEEIILKYIDKILPKSANVELYRTYFDSLTDEEFKLYIERLENKEEHLYLIVPNDGKHKISIKNNIKLAKELGYDLFQNLTVISSDPNKPNYTYPTKTLILDLPFRRTVQTISKKISIPEDNETINMLTYQPTGKSKGAKLSYPELQILSATGLDKSLKELLKYRGGDPGAFKAMYALLQKYGKVDENTLDNFSTGVVSTNTLRSFITGMHFRTTL